MRGEFLGVPLDLLSIDESVNRCEELIESGRFAQHVVINAGKIVLMNDDPELRRIVCSADIVNADGMSVVWGGRFLGLDVPERVTGIDLMEALLSRSEERKWPVYFLGSRAEIIDRFMAECTRRFPHLVIAGYRDGFYDDECRVADVVAASGARVLFLGMPSPMKERFVARQRNRLGAMLTFGVGGTFDVWAGVTKRAPEWAQAWGLEWLFRLLQEPKRMWRRYLVGNTRFLLVVLRRRLSPRRVPPADQV